MVLVDCNLDNYILIHENELRISTAGFGGDAYI